MDGTMEQKVGVTLFGETLREKPDNITPAGKISIALSARGVGMGRCLALKMVVSEGNHHEVI